jgi:hypothetical protein
MYVVAGAAKPCRLLVTDRIRLMYIYVLMLRIDSVDMQRCCHDNSQYRHGSPPRAMKPVMITRSHLTWVPLTGKVSHAQAAVFCSFVASRQCMSF